MRFTNQVAIVTGAGSGIGEAIARLLAQEGAKVVVADMVGERVDGVVGAIRSQHGEALGAVADIRKQEDVERMVAATMERYSRIDILVNDAGVIFFGGVMNTPETEWDRMFDTNVRGIFRCSRAVVPHMAKQGRGKIVNIASQGAFNTSPLYVVYCATKGAVVSLTRAMALDLIRQNIWVNAVCPGGTRTNISRAMSSMAKHEPVPSVPLGYRAEPDDQAKVALFLASSDSDYMVGQCLLVDGGQGVTAYPPSSPWFSQRL